MVAAAAAAVLLLLVQLPRPASSPGAAAAALTAIHWSLKTDDRASTVCSNDLNCSLLGSCAGVCHCDAGWGGPSCATMQLQPVAFPQGYGMDPALQAGVNTSWGGNVIKADGQFHMFVNAISNQCLLGAWMRNSRIDHSVSQTVTGPYEFKDTAVPMWASNPAPVVLPSGAPYKYAIFHIGNGTAKTGQEEFCFAGNGSRIPPHAAVTADITLDALDSNSISVSNSLGGPWKLLEGNTLPACNNPAPWIHPNGTIYSLCDEQIYRADKITGPWAKIGGIWDPVSSRERPKLWHYEDPFLFTTKRGWHVLFHAGVRDASINAGHNCVSSTVSAHLYSEDGYQWHASTISPFGTQVEVVVSEGKTRNITVATRERPKLIFDDTGQMTHIINGNFQMVPELSRENTISMRTCL